MSDFKAKMHQIRFLLGSTPDSAGGDYSAPPDSVDVFKGPTSKRREGKGMGGRKRTTLRTPCRKFLATPLGSTVSSSSEFWGGDPAEFEFGAF